MKKLFLLVLAVAMTLNFSSCSSDESDTAPSSSVGQGYISAKFDGTTEVFNNLLILNNSNNHHQVTATKGTSTEQIFTMSFVEGLVGANMILTFDYAENEIPFTFSSATLTTINSNGVLKGTFSGTITYFDEQTQDYVEVEVTDGKFDIQY